MNTETLHNKNGDLKLKLSKGRRNFKIFRVFDQFKKQNVAFVKIKEMLIERQNILRSTHKGRFVKTQRLATLKADLLRLQEKLGKKNNI